MYLKKYCTANPPIGIGIACLALLVAFIILMFPYVVLFLLMGLAVVLVVIGVYGLFTNRVTIKKNIDESIEQIKTLSKKENQKE